MTQAGRKPTEVGAHEKAAEKVIRTELKEKLSETVTRCLLMEKNESLQELLMKLGRMVERKASDISVGLGEKSKEVREVLTSVIIKSIYRKRT